MSDYRRFRVKGGIYFITLVTHKRRTLFKDSVRLRQLKLSFNQIRLTYPFTLCGWVVLPDHMHFIMRLPNEDDDFSKRVRLIKSHFSKSQNTLSNTRGEKDIWQRRFWEHLIRDNQDFYHHLNYIHYNPVKHDLVEASANWYHSSFHDWVNRGYYSNDWAGIT